MAVRPSTAGEYLLWIARINDDKGPQRAIAAARMADLPLVLAGPVHPGQEEFFAREVEPHIDDDAVRYVGEVGEQGKRELYTQRAGAADADPLGRAVRHGDGRGDGLRHTGDRVPEGSAPEVVIDGETGFVVDDEQAMADAVGRLGEIDRGRCRESVRERFDVPSIVARYERVYERARGGGGRFSRRLAASPPPRRSRRSEARGLGIG